MINYRLTLAYEGTKYKGWQRLKSSDMTIQTKLEMVLSKIVDEKVEVIGSGRTDAGVHAKKQVCNFKINHERDLNELQGALNQFLPMDISVLSIEKVDAKFHARFSAKSKTYVYRVWKASYPPVFERMYVHVHEGKVLDVEKMKMASDYLLGAHDFKAFSSDKTKKSTVRTIHAIEFEETSTEIRIRVSADGFLYNMVRIIVGTLLEVGTGKRESMAICPGMTREDVGETAPARGLTLECVKY